MGWGCGGELGVYFCLSFIGILVCRRSGAIFWSIRCCCFARFFRLKVGGGRSRRGFFWWILVVKFCFRCGFLFLCFFLGKVVGKEGWKEAWS